MSDLLTSISTIDDYLYLSGYAPVTNRQLLDQLSISCIIDATNIPANKNAIIPSIVYIKVPVEDNETARLDLYFDSIADRIESVRIDGGRTLVHCAAGVSRSASLVIAYLVKYGRLSLKDAYEKVHKIRPIICPNNGFWHQLIDYETKLTGNATVKIITTRFRRQIPDVYLCKRII